MAIEKKQTGKKAATSASKTLKDKSTGDDSKSGAGSALSQRKAPKKKTSEPAAKKASKVISDKRTSKASKTAAGSALSQKAGKPKATKTAVKSSGKPAKSPGTSWTGPKTQKEEE